MTPPKKLFAPAALVLALALAGCADMSGIQPQAQQRDAASLGLAAGTQASAQASQVDAQWWRALGDAQLNGLVEQAIAGNPNLRVAQARLARAQAVTEVANSAKLPQVNGSLDATRQLYTENGLVPKPLAGSISENGTLRLSASWELDFFGKYQAALDTALGTARAAQADVEAARILLASNVVRNYVQLARIHDQQAVATRTLAQREEQLRLVRDRVDAGLDTRLELKQSEGGLPEARQQLEALDEAAALSKNALAALVGQPSLQLTPVALSSVRPLTTPTVLPADLLGQRADIAAARFRVEAAGYDIKNAKAQFYPNINLVAFAGLSTIGLGRLLEANSQEWGVGPAIRLPIFEGGRLRANLRGKTADYDAAVETYNATVLDAVRDVADQLASTQSVARQQAQQRQAQEAAEAAYDIAIQRYKAGLGNYLNVLSAENAVLAQRRLAVDLAARAIDSQVGLVRAVGGGYQGDAVTAAAPK